MITEDAASARTPRCPYASGTARKTDAGGAHGTARQWQTKLLSAKAEPLTPVQLLPANIYIMTEKSPEKLKKVAGMKNNSWSPPALQEKLQDTRCMPGTRTGSKLKGYEKLYYNVNTRNLIKEDKNNLSKAKTWEGPRIVNVMQVPNRTPAIDGHVLPGRATCPMPGR